MANERHQVDIDYTNHEGFRFYRRVEPVVGQLVFNYNAYHHDPQWLLSAIDVSGDGTLKTFSMAHVKLWTPMPLTGPLPPAPRHPTKYPRR